MLMFRRYLFELLLWVLLLTGAGLLVLNCLIPQYMFASYPVVPATMIILGLLFYPLLKKAQTAGERNKHLFYMANTGIKMFLSLIIVLIMALNDKPNVVPFAATYFVFYIMLAIF